MALGRTWIDRMIDPLEIVTIDVLMSAERTLVERALGALVCDRALRAVEGRPVGIAFQKMTLACRSAPSTARQAVFNDEP